MAPPLTAVPTLTSVGGRFTQVWTGWTAVGGTSAGATFTRTPTTSDFVPAESYYPTHILVTGDDIAGSFILNEVSKAALAFAFNGANAASVAGTGGNWTTSGTGGATISGFSLPLVGQEVHGMLGWQGQDDDEVLFVYQGINVAAVAPNMTKGPQAQELSINFRGELPTTNADTNNGYTSTQVVPFRWYLAGTGPAAGGTW
jgi:hypothetical protein